MRANDFFQSWREREHHAGRLFITDGIVDPDEWSDAKHKVLFILKEAYDTERTEGTWDLSGLIRSKKVSGRTFKPLAQWAYGVQQVLENREISEFKEHGKEIERALLSSAVINLKKSGGKKKSSLENLQSYVEKDWDLLSRQINEIQPDIVICGRTWSHFSNLVEEQHRVSDQVASVNGVPYVNFWHPANRAANKMSYYSLCALALISAQKSGF